jgi:hypothetical protein
MKRLVTFWLTIGLATFGAKAADMEIFAPDEPSKIERDGQFGIVQTWGRTDAAPAIRFGHRLRTEGLTEGQAEAEIWKEAWRVYPNHRFFARAYAQVARDAYQGKR